MKKDRKVIIRATSFILITTLYIALLLGFSGAVEPNNVAFAYERQADRIIEKSFDVRSGGYLNLETRFGGIEVEGWNRDEVRLKIEISGRASLIDDIEFIIESSIDGVDIKTEIPRTRSLFGDWGRGINLRYTIFVPYEYNTKIKTAGGGITVRKIDGTIDATTSGGAVRADRLSGKINLSTSGGGVTVERLNGDIVLRTSGGGITVDGASGSIEARTSGGPIRMADIDARVDARTSGGGITFSLIGENKGIILRTSGGSITARFPESIQGDLSARTSGGRVSTDFPVTVQGTVSSSSLEGKINGGGPEIELRTSGGSIRINKK